MKITLVPATTAHLGVIARNMRPADVAEIWASNHALPLPALLRARQVSTFCYVALADGVPACAFGVSALSILGSVGSPWMLGTPRLDQIRRPFLRLSRPVVAAMHEQFAQLVNFVDNRNIATLRWLQWLGFQLDEPKPHGPDGVLFRRFSRSRSDV